MPSPNLASGQYMTQSWSPISSEVKRSNVKVGWVCTLLRASPLIYIDNTQQQCMKHSSLRDVANTHLSDREKSSLLLSLRRTKKLPSDCWINKSSASSRLSVPWYQLQKLSQSSMIHSYNTLTIATITRNTGYSNFRFPFNRPFFWSHSWLAVRELIGTAEAGIFTGWSTATKHWKVLKALTTGFWFLTGRLTKLVTGWLSKDALLEQLSNGTNGQMSANCNWVDFGQLTGWLGGMKVRASDLQSSGRGFDSRLGRHQAAQV